MTRDGVAAKSRRSRKKLFITPDEFLAQLHEVDPFVRVRRLDWRHSTWRTVHGGTAIGWVEFRVYDPYLDKEGNRRMDPRELPAYIAKVKANREVHLQLSAMAGASL